MSFGDGSRMPWALGDEAGEPIFRQAIELGITFWDTANIYGHGSSEEIVGRALKAYTRRDDIVLATKLFQPMGDGPGGAGLSRRAVMEQVDASLARLGTDYIDLYQIHRFDPHTPIEETMEALHDVVKAGKVRYLGASSMWAWQFATMQHAADLHGWTRFISMQDQYSLLHREEEREMFGLLAHQGVGAIPWSPLAAGRLARPWGEKGTERSVKNADVDMYGRPLFLDSDSGIVDAVQRDRRSPWRTDGPGRARLGAAQPGGQRTDRRVDQAAPPQRCGGRPRPRAHRRRAHRARAALPAAAPDLLPVAPARWIRPSQTRPDHQ